MFLSPPVSLVKLRLYVKQRRHPLWPLIFSTTGTGCHIPRFAVSERGMEGGVAAEVRWQDCSNSLRSNARYEWAAELKGLVLFFYLHLVLEKLARK